MSADTEKQPPARSNLRNAIALVKDIKPSYAAIALCLAVTLWYTVTVRDKVESWVDVQVVFKDAPDNLIISDGLINKLSVRVRAARGLSRGLLGRDATVVVDLSSITKGSNAIAITRQMLPFNPAFEVVEVSPSRVLIVADTKATKEVALEAGFEGKLAGDLFVKSISIIPAKVVVSGAESLVSGISRIRIPVPLGADVPFGISSVSVAVPAPVNVSVTPPQVDVSLEAGVRTKQMRFTRDITPTAYVDGRNPVIAPEKVTIVAEIPESMTKDGKALARVAASVALPPDMGEEKRKLPVNIALPENAILVSVTPPEVTVSLPDRR